MRTGHGLISEPVSGADANRPVGVKGLDRQSNSLYMCDGFDLGKIHWQIQNHGVLDPRLQDRTGWEVQIITSPSVIGFNQFRRWIHLAVVVDARSTPRAT